jgi:translation initiation factor 3 subunit L
MIAFLAILHHITPAARMEDVILKAIRDNHGNQLSKIEAGEEGYEDLFLFAAPKFIHPAVPDYGQPQPATLSQDVATLQVKQFMSEMSQQQIFRKLRSYMKLYTSIPVTKLAAFNDIKKEEISSYLTSFKHKMRQLENIPLEDDEEDDDVAESSAAPLDGKIGSALDIHYYLVGDVVHVDEAEKQRRFETYFLTQIAQSEDILKTLELMSTNV